MNTIKETAKKLIDELPDEATWDDLMYRLYIRQKVESGLKAAEQGDIVPHEEVKRRFPGP